MLVVFDFDGTLFDTYPLIRENLIKVFEKHLPEYKYTEETLASCFGPPLFDTFYSITDDVDKTNYLIKEYRKINDEHYKSSIKLFPKVKETIEHLSKKYQLAIFSNRVNYLIKEGIEVWGINKYFSDVIGIDDVKRAKPNPDGLEYLKGLYPAKKIVYVGDTIIDIKTATNANVLSVGVTYSLTSEEEFKAAKADYIINNIEDLIDILEGLNV